MRWEVYKPSEELEAVSAEKNVRNNQEIRTLDVVDFVTMSCHGIKVQC